MFFSYCIHFSLLFIFSGMLIYIDLGLITKLSKLSVNYNARSKGGGHLYYGCSCLKVFSLPRWILSVFFSLYISWFFMILFFDLFEIEKWCSENTMFLNQIWDSYSEMSLTLALDLPLFFIYTEIKMCNYLAILWDWSHQHHLISSSLRVNDASKGFLGTWFSKFLLIQAIL